MRHFNGIDDKDYFFFLPWAHQSDSTEMKPKPLNRRRMDTQKLALKTYLVILLQSVLQTKALLDAIRKVVGPWCRFTRHPGIVWKKCKVCIKWCNRKPGERKHTRIQTTR